MAKRRRSKLRRSKTRALRKTRARSLKYRQKFSRKNRYRKRRKSMKGGRPDNLASDETFFGINGVGQMFANGYRGVFDQVSNFANTFTGEPYAPSQNATLDQFIPMSY